MSKTDAIKTFRDLLAFLTIIPLGKTEDFISTSARKMFLFPLIGALIGLLGTGYFLSSKLIVSYLLDAFTFVTHFPTDIIAQFIPPIMTLAFLLVLTGFQHFDGLIDLGNAIGLKKLEERREIAHRWVVTYKGALLAIIVESSAVVGMFLLNWNIAARAIILSEIAAKLAMVTIVWRGKPAHQGLGARFIENAKRKLNLAAFATAFIFSYLLLGWAGLTIIAIIGFFGLFMEQVGKVVFSGVSGDMIGATNESARAITLILAALVLILVPILFSGALFF